MIVKHEGNQESFLSEQIQYTFIDTNIYLTNLIIKGMECISFLCNVYNIPTLLKKRAL